MSETDYNARLYEKMKAEQDKYRDWLLHQELSEIINHTYEYTMREDIVMKEASVCGNVIIYGGKASNTLAFLHLL